MMNVYTIFFSLMTILSLQIPVHCNSKKISDTVSIADVLVLAHTLEPSTLTAPLHECLYAIADNTPVSESLIHLALIQAYAIIEKNTDRIDSDTLTLLRAQCMKHTNNPQLSHDRAPREPEDPGTSEQVLLVSATPEAAIPTPRDIYLRNLFASEDVKVGNKLYVAVDATITGSVSIGDFVLYNTSQTNPLIPLGVLAATAPNTIGPRIAAGSFNLNGDLLQTSTYATGITANAIHAPESGIYAVTFNPPFTIVPIVQATLQDPTPSKGHSIVVQTCCNTTCTIYTYDNAGSKSHGFNLLAIGY